MARPLAAPARWQLAVAGLTLLVALLFRGPLLGGVLFERDIHLVWAPQVEGFVRTVAAGSLPLWDPSPSFGQPLLADPGAEVCYPPTWLNLLVRPWTYFTLFTFGHVLLSTLAFFALARRWGLSVVASAGGAACWALSGPLLSLVTLWHHLAGACLAPVVLLAAEHALARRRPREVVVLGLATGAQVLAGSADMVAMTMLALAVWIAAVHVDWRRPAGAWRAAAVIASALVIAALVSAGQWVASLQLAGQASRRALPEAIRTYWSAHPVGLADILFAGVPRLLAVQPSWRQLLYENREPFLLSLYLGLPAAALVVSGLFGRGSRRMRIALGVILLGALLVALGRYAPFYSLATTLVPPLRILRYPVKALVFASFAWCGLVAFGLDTWRQRQTLRARALAVAPAVIAAAVAAVGAFLALTDAAVVRDLFAGTPLVSPVARSLALHAAAALVVAALGLTFPRRSAGFAAVIAAVVAADLALAHPAPSPVAPPALYRHRPAVLAALGSLESARVYAYDYSEAPRAGRWGFGSPHVLARIPDGWEPAAASALGMQMSLAPQTAGRWGLRQGFDLDLRGLQPEPLAHFTRLVRVFEDRPGALLRLLQLAAVTHVVAQHELPEPRLRLQGEDPGLFEQPIRAYAVPDPLPRVRAVAGTRVAEGLDALHLLVDPSFDPRTTVVLPRGRELAGPPGWSARTTFVEDRPDRLTIDAELPGDGYVVIADSWDPGWQAELDGRPIEVQRANVAFRAVAVPAGVHRVTLVYRPRAVLVALAVSLVVLTAAVAYLVGSWLRARAS